ncbi:HelD family protein [Propionispora hippei]|uniref:DNA helicase-2 / ATP-dependent DNA helicase PcrA n=1 Tax=Propionispora hippei DSM 15287 TaxID=1123003 RepID=A0A1M6L8U8_9FIRM|nr:UvrD-helicase domain-containing protein [Propionispora hippei]SHJ67631.1 DNA helicase-2 / ATP-dependent DNA helicase PcrA [Propionispora hippei DSM 15287]
MTQQHSEFDLERQHLAKTIADMKQIVEELNTDIDERLQRAQKSLSLKDEISAYVHTMLRSDHSYRIHDLEAALPSPYFGRVDFREDGTPDFRSYYIGRTKVARLHIEQDEDILVFDWRDPVSTIFYECYGGRASYEVLGRYHYEGDVRVKRQYKIEDGELKSMVDNYVMEQILTRQQQAMLGDPLLTERLKAGAADKLKDIITSIQAEQNQIIRQPLQQVTIIQGVAGSGKSTIGLHRLSYLLYNERLKPERLIVIAPNRIFLDYISDLLPDIDAADVKQLVWDDLVTALTGRVFTVTANDRLEHILAGRDKKNSRLLADTAQLKGSLDFLKVLQAYVEHKLQRFCVKLADIHLFDGGLTVTAQEQLDTFMEDGKTPYNERLRSLIRHITFRVNNYVEVLEARQKQGTVADETVKRCVRERDKFLGSYFKRWQPLELLEAYRELYASKMMFKPLKDMRYDLDAIRSHSQDVLSAGLVEREDLALLAYLAFLLDGWPRAIRYDHIVVDEAQDLNAVEFDMLKRLSSNGSFTIMGDVSQGIHSYRSISSWNVLTKGVFAGDRTVYREILHSYRSAKEIIDVFNCVVPAGHSPAIPVYETGRRPVLKKMMSVSDGLQHCFDSIKEFIAGGAASVAVITKREAEAIALFEPLSAAATEADLALPVYLLAGEETLYRGGISIVPVALAKGLEFDAVVVWNASATEYPPEPLTRRLLYVALSRAMHNLHILYQGNLTPLLKDWRPQGDA